MRTKDINITKSTSPNGLVGCLDDLINGNTRALKQISKDIKKYRRGYWADRLQPLFKYTQGYLDALNHIKAILEKDKHSI